MQAGDSPIFDAPPAEIAAADADLWSLYAESMPAEEREPRSIILASVRAGDAVLTRARRGAVTIGFAVTHLLRRPPAAFLVYLAVAAESRGTGIGSRLFEHAWITAESVAARRGSELKGLVWEVDDPQNAPDDAERRRRLSRLKFFMRLGGAQLTGAYFQPPVNGPKPVPMLLIWRGKPGWDAPPVPDLVRAIYFEKYGAANGISAGVLEELFRRVHSS